jgi:hypothetical protein
MTQNADSERSLPNQLGLEEHKPNDTYLDEYVRVWIGSKWDIAQDAAGRFAVYRKGNWRITVGTLALACAIVADNEGYGTLSLNDSSGGER